MWFLAGCFVGVVVTVFAIAMCFAAKENDSVQMELRGRCSVCGRVIGPDGRCPMGCGYQAAAYTVADEDEERRQAGDL